MSSPFPSTSGPPSPTPLYRRMPIRIACVQLDPKLGRVQENAAKVEAMTKSLRPGSVDLLVLPEMALSGYVFSNPTSILPYLEQPRIGPTSLLSRSLAQRLRCHVVAGYPEAFPSSSSDASESSSGASSEGGAVNNVTKAGKDVEDEGEGVGWNSAVIVGPTGEVLGNYRKTFLFETDKNWAKPGLGFTHFDLPEPLGRVALGICMDMNPKDFLAPFDAYELASYARDNQVDMLVVPMNWLQPDQDDTSSDQDLEAPSESTLNYWAARLTPLHDPTPSYFASPKVGSEVDDETGGNAKEVVFVGCNRTGTEEGTTFVGSSCVMTVSSSPSRIELVECCSVSEERVMLATVS